MIQFSLAWLRRIGLGAFSLALIASIACAGLRDRRVYQAELKKWTRANERYQEEVGFISIKWHATLLSPAMLSAQSSEVERVYADSGEWSEFEAARQELSGDAITFFVNFYGFDRRYMDLSKETSDWEISLDNKGRRYEPISIQRINRVTPMQRRLYPYVDLWSTYYLVSFPRTRGENYQDLTLSVRGPDGHDSLHWD